MGIGTRRGRERKLSSRPGRRIPEAEMASMSSEAAPSDVDSTLPMMEVRFVLQHGNSHQSVENNARVSDDDARHRPTVWPQGTKGGSALIIFIPFPNEIS